MLSRRTICILLAVVVFFLLVFALTSKKPRRALPPPSPSPLPSPSLQHPRAMPGSPPQMPSLHAHPYPPVLDADLAPQPLAAADEDPNGAVEDSEPAPSPIETMPNPPLVERNSNPNPNMNATNANITKARLQLSATSDQFRNMARLFARSSNALATRLFVLLADADAQHAGFVFAPTTITCSLLPLYVTAKGATQHEMLQTAQLYGLLEQEARKDNHLRMMCEFATLWKRLLAQSGVHSAQALLVREDLAEHMPSDAKQLASLCTQIVPWSPDNAHVVVAGVNGNMGQELEQNVRDLLPADSLTPETALVLLSGLFSRAAWQTPFAASDTRAEPFVDAALGSRRSLPMMRRAHATESYFENTELQLVELPFAGQNQVVFGLLLPKQRSAWSMGLAGLSLDTFRSVLPLLRPAELSVLSLPRFEARLKMDLIPWLRTLGLKRLFEPGAAELDGLLAPAEDKNHAASVSNMWHEVAVRFDEQGAAAAAVTSARATLSQPPAPKTDKVAGLAPKPIEFVANRPFVYYLRHLPTHALLVAGVFA